MKNNHNNNIPYTQDENSQGRSKRERPPSSYFEAPPILVESPTSNDLNIKSKDFASPLFKRQPFKNLSNIVIPNVRRKLSSSTKSFTQSMSNVSKTSHSFFHSNVETSTPTKGLGIGIGIGLQLTDEDEVDDGEETTEEDIIIPNSPIQASRNTRSIRRIHSLCQTTKEIESFVPMDDNSHLKNTTIHTFSVENDLLPRIDETELYKILKGEHKNAFDKCVIVDCRFDYEFEGGHIDGALNISTKEEIEKAFINNIKSTNDNLKTLYVFHCEFSIFRGPTIASHLRKCDRRFNRDVYPYLSYPDIVILEGGYKKFYNTYRDLCFPQGYIEMRDVNHEKHCENRMEQVRLDSKLTRAKSFNQYDNFFESPDNYSSTPNLPLPFTHHRSQSYTTITSEKILKRQRSNSKVKTLSSSSIRLSRASTFSYDQTIFNSNPSSSPLPFHLNNGSSGSGSGSSNNIQDGESLFLPPSTSFSKSSNSSSHRKSYSSCASLNSSSSSVNFSDSNNGLFSSTESLSDSSPMLEFPEYFDSKGTLIRHNSLNICKPLNKKPSGPVPALPNRVMSNSMTIANNNHPNSNFKFPNTIKSKPSRLSLNNRHQGNSTPVGISSNIGTPANVSNKFTNNPFLVASPLISSPLSNTTPLSTLGSTLSTHGQSSSIIDPINDTPVDFSVPIPSKINSITSRYINHSRRTSGSLLSSAGGGLYNFIDIDEAEEEDDEEDDEEEEDEEEDDDVTYYDSTNNTKVTTPGNTINIEKVEPTIFGVKSPFDS